MVWTNAGVINPSRNWQYTNVVEGDLFRLSHNYSDLPTEYFQAELTQIEEDEDGSITTFGYQVIEASPTSEVIQLIKPACFSNRKIAIRQLSRDVDLPPAGRVYSWAIGIEAYDPNEAPPPPPPEPPNAAGQEYTVSQSSSYVNNPASIGTYANLSDNNTTTGCVTNSGNSWIQATFSLPVKVNTVTIGAGIFDHFGGIATLVNASKLQYSTDNTTWVDVLQFAGLTNGSSGWIKTFTLPSPIVAQHWRIANPSDWVAASELKFE